MNEFLRICWSTAEEREMHTGLRSGDVIKGKFHYSLILQLAIDIFSKILNQKLDFSPMLSRYAFSNVRSPSRWVRPSL